MNTQLNILSLASSNVVLNAFLPVYSYYVYLNLGSEDFSFFVLNENKTV